MFCWRINNNNKHNNSNSNNTYIFKLEGEALILLGELRDEKTFLLLLQPRRLFGILQEVLLLFTM